MTAAITIIKDEHRALAAVLHGLLYLNEQVRNAGQKPDFPLLKAMLDYIVAFPDRLHSTVLDPDPVSSTGWHFRRDDSCLTIEDLRQRLAQIPFLLSRR